MKGDAHRAGALFALALVVACGVDPVGAPPPADVGTAPPPTPPPPPTPTPTDPEPHAPAPRATEVHLGGAPPARASALTISTGALVPPFDPDVTEYNATALGSLFPIDVEVDADPRLAITVNGQAVKAGAPLPVTLKPLQDITITLVAENGGEKSYTIHYLPPMFHTYTVSQIDPAAAGTEPVLLTPDRKWLLVTSRAGDPLYYRMFAPVGVLDFKRQFVAGTGVAYSFHTNDGRVHLVDGRMRDVQTVELLPNRDHGALAADGHDFLLLGPEHYVAMAYVKKTVDLAALNPSWPDAAGVVAGVIQEIDHGTVLFEWDTTDIASLYSDSVEQNVYKTVGHSDYAHINSVQVDPADGNFIVSMRHTDSVVKLDRTTGAILWTLGGLSDDFGLTVAQRFSHQHHARKLADGTLLLFDNANKVGATRVLSFVLDEVQRTVTSFTEVYTRPAGQGNSTFMGSVFRMAPTRYVIGWGGRTSPALDGPAVTELVDGAPVWTLTFNGPSVFSYRAALMAPE